MVCNVGISTRSSECSGLKGMFVGVSSVSSCAVCGERDGCWCTLMCGVWVGMRVGSVLFVDEVWSDGSRGSECYVSASIGRRL
jgi:hypothetical protein